MNQRWQIWHRRISRTKIGVWRPFFIVDDTEEEAVETMRRLACKGNEYVMLPQAERPSADAIAGDGELV